MSEAGGETQTINPYEAPPASIDLDVGAVDASSAVAPAPTLTKAGPVMPVLFALSGSHLLNDTLQSLLPSIYPILREQYDLSYAQIGMITFVFQMAGSVFQPLVGYYTDKRPLPYSLAFGMFCSLVGILTLSFAGVYGVILLAAGTIGIGSSIFHPESSRVARMASGGRYGFAQSLFQVGGNSGTALGPFLAALVIVPFGQRSIAVFSILAIAGIGLLTFVGRWYSAHLAERANKPKKVAAERRDLSRGRIAASIGILLLLIFSKYFYLVSLTSYYPLYLIQKFDLDPHSSTPQILLGIFLAAVAVGTIAGGPIGDRIGFKAVIWASILGVLPFTLALPHMGLIATAILTVPIGLIMASAFSAIMVYAQELLPSRVGLVAGLFFGFAFGIAGIGAGLLGELADARGLDYVYSVCAWLPAIGILTALLPNLKKA
ncbi:MAG: MFS transporter [Pirellulales bacterium]